MTSPTKQPISSAGGPGAASVPLFTGGGGSQSVVIPLLGGSRMSIVVPPGGFAGFAQQTPATQVLFQRAGRVGGKRSAAKRRRRKAKAAPAARKRRKSTARPARLKKGSAAAKRYMASIRKRRKR